LAEESDRGAALGLQAAVTGISALPASLAAGFLWEKVSPASAFVLGAVTAAAAGAMMLSIRVREPNRRN
jgi:hypothetical protein